MAVRTLSTLNSKLKLLAVGTNAKTVKGDGDGSLTAIMYLASSDISGYDTCPAASEGCRTVCLITSGHGAMTSVQQARVRKTKMFFEDQEAFLQLLKNDLQLFQEFCELTQVQGYVRLNGTSDIKWEDYSIIEEYPDLCFYDYTKIRGRDVSSYKNYKLTFSRSEDHADEDIKSELEAGHTVAIVFDEVPDTYLDTEVISGDLSDMRWKDPPGVIVGLKAKGKARKSSPEEDKGFVIRIKNI